MVAEIRASETLALRGRTHRPDSITPAEHAERDRARRAVAVRFAGNRDATLETLQMLGLADEAGRAL